jgi:hypothetical protein
MVDVVGVVVGVVGVVVGVVGVVVPPGTLMVTQPAVRSRATIAARNANRRVFPLIDSPP